MKKLTLAAAALCLLPLGGCVSGENGTDAANEAGAIAAPDFGQSVKANTAAQTVNPDAGATPEAMNANGAAAALAYSRYEKDQVKAPEDTGAMIGATSGGSGTGTQGSSAGH